MKNPGSAVRVFLIASAVAVAAASSASAAALRTSIVPGIVAQHGVVPVGEVAPSTHLRLQVVLPMRNLADLRSLLDDQIYNPNSVFYHHYLSVAEFTARFGPAQSDYDAAMRFFNTNGFGVTHI
jgi:subtilase family serine protease